MGMIVSDSLRKRESLQQIKDSLPSWCNPEQAQQLNLLKVSYQYCSITYSQNLVYSILVVKSFILCTFMIYYYYVDRGICQCYFVST